MTLGVCDGCGRLGIVGTKHTKVTVDSGFTGAMAARLEPCGTHRRTEPPEPERKEPLWPDHGRSPERKP